MLVLCGLIAMTFAATSREMLLAAQLLCGFPWGTINTIARKLELATI
jgi:hypothetical protein